MNDKATINASELADYLRKEERNSKALTSDQLLEFSITALNTLRGLNRGDKIKVIRRMRKLLDA